MISYYGCLERLGEGYKSEVYRAIPIYGHSNNVDIYGNDVCIKLEFQNNDDQIRNEHDILNVLKGCYGVPKEIDYGLVKENQFYPNRCIYRAIVIDIIGINIADYFQKKKPSNEEINMVWSNLKQILTGIHNRGIIIGDIKPQHFIVHFQGLSYGITLVDYGASVRIGGYTTYSTKLFSSTNTNSLFSQLVIIHNKLILQIEFDLIYDIY